MAVDIENRSMLITESPISAGDFVSVPGAGAVATFTGVVRAHNAGRKVTGIFYECYRDLAETECNRIIDEVAAAHPLRAAHIAHRVGELKVGDAALLVVVASDHRGEAFAAVQCIVDLLKQRAAIWKKERYDDGTSAWL